LVEKLRAATVSEPGVLEIKEYEKPPLDSKAWLLKIEMAGICGTDHHMINNRRPFRWAENSYPFIPGHEFVGRIEEVGPIFAGVDVEGQPLRIGDLVAVCPDGNVDSSPCGRCYYCVNGFPAFCSNRVPKELPPLLKGWQRGYAEYRYIHGVEAVYKLPEDMPLEVAVLVEPLGIAIHAFERASDMGSPWLFQGMGPGKIIVIQGSGPIGILLTVTAQLCGAGKTIVVGAPENRLALCREFGADETISIEKYPTSEERAQAVKELTPFSQGADIVIEAAGVPGAFQEGIEMVRDRGTFVELGHFTDRGQEPVSPFTLCAKNINLFGMFGGGPAGFLWAKRVLERYRHKIPLEKIVTHKFPLNKVKEALETSRKMESMKTALVP